MFCDIPAKKCCNPPQNDCNLSEIILQSNCNPIAIRIAIRFETDCGFCDHFMILWNSDFKSIHNPIAIRFQNDVSWIVNLMLY